MIIENYKRIANYMASVLGEKTEIVLHDFRNLEHSIVHIINGHITNRKIGDTVTDLVLEFLMKNKTTSEGYLSNYVSKSINGKTLHSSTLFIFDDDHELVGALCTNTDYSEYQEALESIKKLLPNSGALTPGSTGPIIENLYADHETLTLSIIQEEIDKTGISPKRMTADEKQNIVNALHQKGMFMLKGAVQETALKLEVSEPTMYRYIRAAKQNI